MRLVLFAALISGIAGAQEAPDEWVPPPVFQPMPQPAPLPPVAPYDTPPPLPAPDPVPLTTATTSPPIAWARPGAPVLPRNRMSVVGAVPLGQKHVGLSVYAGFPTAGVQALVGATSWLDVGLGFDWLWGLSYEGQVLLRATFARTEEFGAALTLQGSAIYFPTRAPREDRGPRWLTGKRNFNASPGVVLTYQARNFNAARFSFEGRYLLSLDSEPFVMNPLGGLPPLLVPGHNIIMRFHAEIPLSATTAVVVTAGGDIHLRVDDSPFMFVAALGVVTAF